MNFLDVTAARWANAEMTAIDCTVETEELGIIPFTAAIDDPAPHSRDLFERFIAGEIGDVAPFVAPPAVPVSVQPPRLIAIGSVKIAAGVPSAIIGSGFSGATRLTAGRIRMFFETPQPDRDYIATPGMHHSAATDLRISAKTEDYVELRSTAEALEYSLTVMRVA